MLRDQVIQRLALPERIVSRMLHQPPRPRQLIQTACLGVVAGRAGAAEFFVVVIGVARSGIACIPLGGLLGEVVQVDLAKRSVVKPVVAHPAINHGALRRGHFQSGMRREQRHHHGESFIGGADHAHAAVGFRRVLHQPVDGVIGVGNVIGCGGVERAADGPRHHVFAFRFIFAAHVLEDADIAVGGEDLVSLRKGRPACGCSGCVPSVWQRYTACA